VRDTPFGSLLFWLTFIAGLVGLMLLLVLWGMIISWASVHFVSLPLFLLGLPWCPSLPPLQRSELMLWLWGYLQELHLSFCTRSFTPLSPKFAFYPMCVLYIVDMLIIQLCFLWFNLLHGFHFPLSQLRVCTQQSRVETNHRFSRVEQIWRLCSFLLEVEIEEHFIFRCPLYYDSSGRFHCFYRDSSRSLLTVFKYFDQWCLAL